MNEPPENLRVLVPAHRIQARIAELGREIDRDYPDGDLVLVGILKGAFVFMADLCRALSRPARCDFMGISSYGKEKSSSGEVRLTKDLDSSIDDAHIIVIEDIIDTGVTLSYLVDLLNQRRPRSVRVAALLDKPSRRKRPVAVDYRGFEIPDEFVVGYGLDYAERYRNLKDVCVLES